MQTTVTSSKWINGLDTLRFILALIVLLSHLDISEILPNDNHFFFKLLKLTIGNAFVGVCAVIAFFVISGIVIHLPYSDKNNVANPINYLIRRYLRIGIPMIAAVLIAFVFNLKTDIFPLWSLYCELFYYTIFPLLLILIRKIGINKVLVFSFIISYLIIIAVTNSLADFIHQNKSYNGNYWQMGTFITCIIGLPCWLLGVKIAEDMRTLLSSTITAKRIYLMRACVFLAAFFCSVARFHFSLSYLLSLNIFAILAYSWIKLEITFWKDRRALSLLENAGKWSYSLYLCHALGIIWVAHFFPSNSTWHILTLQCFTSLAISYLFYLVIEKTSHHFIRKIKFDF